MKRYYFSGLSPATRGCYKAGLKKYMEFCLQAHLPTIPTSERTLLLFATHLANLNLSYPTIKVYMAAVRSAHVTLGHHGAFEKQYTPRLDQLMRGIQKEKCKTCSPKVRLPITMDIMAQFKSVLTKHPKNYQSTMIWAAYCTAFFGFLRVSEFTVPSRYKYDPDVHQSLSDVTLDNTHSPELVRLHIKQSKTDTFRKGTYIHLGRTYQNVCPVQALLLYLAIRGKQPGPLFLLSDNTMLTRRYFASALKDTIGKLNLDTHSYNTHSFRIGAATSAKQAGVSDVHIKTLGRWQSDAYQRYIRTSPKELASLSKQLIRATSDTFQ